MYLREELGGSDYVKCLLLFYGWYGLKDSASQRLLGGPWDGLTEAEWQWYKELYAEDTAELETSPYANLFLNDLTRDMPSCYIAAAEYDPLKDDSTALATILEEYGIPHRFEMFEGVIHAFLHYTKMLDEANLALEHGAEYFRQQMGAAGAHSLPIWTNLLQESALLSSQISKRASFGAISVLQMRNQGAITVDFFSQSGYNKCSV